ncbi:MAG: tripartite tricarboxylate transporter substrate binding protein [Pseudomonadota bacterium]
MKSVLSTSTKWLMATAAAVALVALPGGQAKAEFPEKPVEMTILFGGTAQTIGQLLADLMSREMSEPVVAVSRTGGGGAVGYIHVQSTDADGHSIVWNSNSVSTAYHRGNMPFSYEAFAPIARISTEIPALAVHVDSGWETLQDMVDDITASGENLKVGNSGNGSFTHLTTAAVMDAVGLSDSIVNIPYGAGEAPTELLAGRIDATIQWPGQFLPHVEAGNLRILCVTSAERIDMLPDTPTCAESGAEGVDITMWRGLAAPAGTPDEVIDALEAAASAAVESEQFQEAAQNIGFESSFLGSEDFAELIARDDERISQLLKDLGM